MKTIPRLLIPSFVVCLSCGGSPSATGNDNSVPSGSGESASGTATDSNLVDPATWGGETNDLIDESNLVPENSILAIGNALAKGLNYFGAGLDTYAVLKVTNSSTQDVFVFIVGDNTGNAIPVTVESAEATKLFDKVKLPAGVKDYKIYVHSELLKRDKTFTVAAETPISNAIGDATKAVVRGVDTLIQGFKSVFGGGKKSTTPPAANKLDQLRAISSGNCIGLNTSDFYSYKLEIPKDADLINAECKLVKQ